MIISLLYLGLLFVLSILCIVAVGIFMSRHLRGDSVVGGMLFTLFFGLFLLRVMTNVYLAFVHRIILTQINILFDLLPLIGLFIIYRKLKPSLRTTVLEFSMYALALLFLIDFIFFFYYHSLLGLVYLAGLACFFLLVYFLGIAFMIDGGRH